MRPSIPIIISIFCVFNVRAATQPQTEQNPPPIDPKNMDTSVKPGDDFFRYANGAWVKRTEIPPEYSRWGAFNELIEHNNDALHVIVAQAVQGGLGMPDRDYYTKQDADMKEKRQKYVAHVTKMLTLLGEPAEKAAEDAKKIMALETKLAEASRTRVQLRDPIKNYNKMGVRQLQDLTPDWNWSDYFKKIDLVEPGDINVRQPEFFKAAANSFKSTPIDDWKAYLRWNLINATAPYLSKDFVDEEFDFNERTLRGTQQIKPRWKRVIVSEDDAIGEALGKLYVGFYFPPEAKARAL